MAIERIVNNGAVAALAILSLGTSALMVRLGGVAAQAVSEFDKDHSPGCRITNKLMTAGRVWCGRVAVTAQQPWSKRQSMVKGNRNCVALVTG